MVENLLFYDKNDGIQHLIVPAVQVVLARMGKRGREVFLGRRTTGSFVGQWSFPGGVVDPGETSVQAAVREVREEVGVRLNQSQLDPLRKIASSTIREKNGLPIKYTYIIDIFLVDATHLSPFIASPLEHDQMHWFTTSDALKMHNQAIKNAQNLGLSLEPDRIPGALAPKVLETIKILSGS